MKNLFKLLLPYKFKAIFIMVFLVVQAYCDMALPRYTQHIIDTGIINKGFEGAIPEGLTQAEIDSVQTAYIWKEGGIMVLMAVIMFAAAAVVAFYASRIGADVGRDLRKRVYSRVLAYSSAEMDKFSTASLITRCTNDVQQIQLVMTMILRMMLYAPVMCMWGIINVANTGAGLEWIIALGVLSVIGLVLVMISLTMPKFRMMQTLVDALNKVSREILTGLPVIRAFGSEKMEEERFDQANRALTETQLFTNRAMALMQPGMMIIMNGIVVLITWTAAGKINDGVMQVGEMTAFISYSMMIVLSFLIMSIMSITLPRAGVAADRINEILTTEPSIVDPEDSIDPVEDSTAEDQQLAADGDDEADSIRDAAPDGQSAVGTAVKNHAHGEVVFSHVDFRYPGADEDALADIDFTARAGETTAIVGSTGSGKSTLVNLIPRFYDVTGGSVSVNGVDVRHQSLHALRESIGFVPQKGVLFSGTIADNIRFGNENASDEEVRAAAATAQAAGFIEEKEDGFDSRISQGGSNVSGGQKQRLAIARAIAKKPDIMVFDDSFSALDMKTDAALRNALAHDLRGVTRIIVAQRVSTVIHAKQIIVLDEGRICGKGTHKELMESCRVYREIAESQLSAAELEELANDKGRGRHQ